VRGDTLPSVVLPTFRGNSAIVSQASPRTRRHRTIRREGRGINLTTAAFQSLEELASVAARSFAVWS
jgi:hypothetical protein